MSEQICPKCGRPLAPDKPCANCLLQLAAEETEFFEDSSIPPTDVTNPYPEGEGTIDIETIRGAFPQLEILEYIGRGGMGTVFKARQPKLDRIVALKILSTDLENKPGFAERFAQEGKLLALLSHPSIVAVYDFGESGGFYYLLLEYVDGVNLRQAMREEHFTPEQAVAIVPKICEALQYAHEEGVLHRDIKPENILLDTKGRVKIADFGIAKLTRTNEPNPETALRSVPGSFDDRTAGSCEGLTEPGQILGTPSYMAPEQLEDSHRVDHRADIYSLGVVFYELLTGELPRGHFPVPSEKTPVGADIDNIVLKALSKEKEKRQQSAEELKTEITATREFMGNEPRTSESNAQLPAPKKMSLWAAFVIALGLVAAVPFLVVSVTSFRTLTTPLSDKSPNELLFFIGLNFLPIALFTALVWLLRNRGFSREQIKNCRQFLNSYQGALIVLTGLLIPYIANAIGGYVLGFKPCAWLPDDAESILAFFVISSLLIIPIIGALVCHFASRTFWGFLKYFPLITGYGFCAYYFSQIDMSSDALAGVGLFLIPFCSLTYFIGGYFLACFINFVVRRWGADMKAGSATKWSDRINPPNDPVTALRSVPGFHNAAWGCALLILGFVLFCLTVPFSFQKQRMSISGDVVRINGKVVDMTPAEAAEKLLPRPSTVGMFLGLGLLASALASVCLATGLGWRRLNLIRKTPEKPDWLPAMIAALFVPLFLLWFIPWLIGVSVGARIGREFQLYETGQFLGGLAAFFLTLCAAIPIIWLTYRWVFPAARNADMQAGSATEWSDRINPPNDPVTAPPKIMSLWAAFFIATGIGGMIPVFTWITAFLGALSSLSNEPPNERVLVIGFSFLPIALFMAFVWLLRNRGFSREQRKNCRQFLYSRQGAVVVLTGLLIPNTAIFRVLFVFDPTAELLIFLEVLMGFFVYQSVLIIPIIVVLVCHFASRTFWGFLKYFSFITGYGFYAYYFFQMNMGDAQGAIGMLFIPFCSLTYFIGGYFLACFINFVVRRWGADMQAGSATQWSDRIAPPNDPVTALRSVPGFPHATDEPSGTQRHLAIASLVCLIAALLIFCIAVPEYYQMQIEPQEKEQYRLGLAKSEMTKVSKSVEMHHENIQSLLNREVLDPIQEIDQRIDLEAEEALLAINEKWLEQRHQAYEAAKQEADHHTKQENTLTRAAWFSLLGLPSILLVVSLWLGFVHLKRLRYATDKSGFLQTSLVVLLAPCLLPVSTIYVIVQASGGIGQEDPYLSIQTGFFVFIACMVALYCFGLYRVIQATRLPQSARSHASRGYLAMMLVLLGLLVPLFGATIGIAGLQGSMYREKEYKESMHRAVSQEEKQRNAELSDALAAVAFRVEKEMDAVAGDESRTQEMREYQRAHERLTHRTSVFAVSSVLFTRMVETPSIVAPSEGAVFLVSLFPLFLLFFALPGTILGWIHVFRIRRERERPGLLAGLFAALAFPLLFLVWGLGWSAYFIFYQWNWGAYQDFVPALAVAFGVLCSLTLAGAGYLIVRWLSDKGRQPTAAAVAPAGDDRDNRNVSHHQSAITDIAARRSATYPIDDGQQPTAAAVAPAGDDQRTGDGAQRSPRRLAAWGCALLIPGFVLFGLTIPYSCGTLSRTASVSRSVSVSGNVVRIDGKVVDMTPQEVREKSLAGPSTVGMFLGLGLLLGALTLVCAGTGLGWRHLNRIRQTPEKPDWLPAMIAALFVPLFLLWFIPWLFGVSVGARIGREFQLYETGQFLGGLAAFFLTLCAAIPIIWLTYRWVFPKPAQTNPAQPSPKGWAIWGASLVLAALLLFGLGFGLVVMTNVGLNKMFVNLRVQEQQHDQQVIEYRRSIAVIEEQIKESTDERHKESLQWHLASLLRNQAQQHEQFHADQIQSKKQIKTVQSISRIGISSVGFIGLVLAVLGTVFGWIHLSRIRGERERPGLLAGLFAALAFPVACVIGVAVASVVDLGLLVVFTVVLGILTSVGIAVRYWL